MLRKLPSVDKLTGSEQLEHLVASYGLDVITRQVKVCLADLRNEISSNPEEYVDIGPEELSARLVKAVELGVAMSQQASLKKVFNLTGTVIHTNLGRAVLAKDALACVTDIMSGASTLEYDLHSGTRGDRDSHIEALICELTGAEAATVVNNNAAAVLLVLNTFASGKSVIVSRGELVEIGGAFRIPDIMERAGCQLEEVGTTNRTHESDYTEAIDESTGLLLKVHTSNYEINGFTKSVPEAQLSDIAKEYAIPLVSDLGSGALIDLGKYGLPSEPTVNDAITAGVDIVTFSGDKLLGGPQAGIIAGQESLIRRIKKNPLKRALRVDKIILAALIGTLRLYQNPSKLIENLPILRDLCRPPGQISELAERLLPQMRDTFAGIADVSIEPCKSQIGSGALPLDTLASVAIKLTPIAMKGNRDEALLAISSAVRSLPLPIIGRVNDGSLFFDLRCLQDEETFVRQLKSLQLPGK